jgi:hypothetical protein
VDYLVVVHPSCCTHTFDAIKAYAEQWIGHVVQFSYYTLESDPYGYCSVYKAHAISSMRTDVLIRQFGEDVEDGSRELLQAEALAQLLDQGDTVHVCGGYKDLCVRQQIDAFMQHGIEVSTLPALIEPNPSWYTGGGE